MRLLHVSLAALLAQFALASNPESPERAKTLNTRFSYTANVPSVPNGSNVLEVWLPIPSDNAFQKITNLRVDSPVDHLVTRERQYGNRMIYVYIPDPKGTTSITVSFDVERTEGTISSSPEPMGLSSDQYLEPDRLVPIDGRYRDIAAEVANGATGSHEKAKAFFDHVIDTMEYDYKKESPKLGEGDVAFVCDYKRGNCSDLHSYLISLSRAMGVPAYLEFGFPITGVPLGDPLAKSGKIGGYHCWAWLQVDGKWLPLDASDGKKWIDIGRSKEKNHLFGNLILERSAVAVSRGRDLVLEPAQQGSPLNNFIYPYAEADGKSVEADWTLEYTRLDGADDVQSQIDELRELVMSQQKQIEALTATKSSVNTATAPIVASVERSATLTQNTSSETSPVIASVTPSVGQRRGAQRRQDSVNVPTKEKIDVYGFLRTDAIYDSQEGSPNGQFPMFIKSPDNTNGTNDRFTLHPRLTRVGLNFTAPDGSVPGWDVTGKIEFDFQGGGSESRPNPRGRHLYVKMAKDNQSWLFGQTSDLISPLYPSPNDDSLMWNAGNLGDRRPQIRYTASGETEFAVALGLTGAIDGKDLDGDGVRDGEDSGTPHVQARVGFGPVGVWGHVGAEQTNTAIAGERNFQSSSLGFDFKLSLTNDVSIQGEAWTGSNLSDMRGGVGQGVNTTTGDEIRSSGGWAELGFQATPTHKLAFGYTIDDPVNGDIAAGGRTRNSALYLANKWTLGKNLEFGLNYLHWTTDYLGANTGRNNRFNFYVKRKF